MTSAPAAIVCAAFIAGVGAGGALPAGPTSVGAAALIAAVVALGLAAVARPLILPLSLAAALLGLARAELGAADPATASRAALEAGSLVAVRGEVAEDARPNLSGFDVLVRPLRIESQSGPLPAAGNLLVRVRGPGDPQLGDQVSLVGRLRLPTDRPGFDRKAYLAQRHAFLEVQVPRLEVIAGGSGPARWAGLPARLRAGYRRAVATLLPPPFSDLLIGVVLGIRSGIPAQLERDLIATGLIHILVLSGLKVAIFIRILGALLRPLLGRAAIFPLLALVAVYALAGGATAAAVRAAVMGGLVALALVLGRPAHVWTSLAAVGAVMLGVSPELISDAGYQLSFVGTAAIILLTPGLEERLARVPGVIREPFAVTLAAQLGTLPLTATDFHLLSPSAPFANALVLPLLPALVVGGLLLPLLAPLPELGRLLALPLAGMLQYTAQVASVLARVPGASLPAPDLSGPWGAAYYLGGAAVLAGARLEGRRRRALIGAGVMLPVLIAGAELAAWGHGEPSVAILSVGEGQAVLATGPEGHLLIDAGGDPGRLAAELGQRLPPWERELTGLVLTGTSSQEAGALAGAGRTFAQIVLPDAPLQGSAWRQGVLESQAAGARVRAVKAGASFRLAGLWVEALAPEAGGTQLAVRLSRPGGRSFCALGELDADGQEQVAGRLQSSGRGCDILLLPGGGHTAPPARLLAAAHPVRLIASLGGGRVDRSLPLSAVERTDQEGTVVIPLGGG